MKITVASPAFKTFAVFTAFNFLFQMVFPTISFALTGGPSRPESGTFVQSGVNELVNPFTGDFSYNIPLLSVPGPGGGYPINLSYQSGISIEQEASWVGLGWNLDAGAVTRTMRGIPDDFDGAKTTSDAIKKVRYARPMRTVRLTLNDLPIPSEAFGADAKKALDAGVNYGVYYNNYKGFGFSMGVNLCVSAAQERVSDVQQMGTGLSGTFGFNYDSNGGLSFSPSISYAGKLRTSLGATISSNRKYNGVRLGMQNGPIRAGYSMSAGQPGSYSAGIGGITARGSGSSFNHPTGLPGSDFPNDGFDAFLQVKGGGQLVGVTADLDLEGSYSETKIADNEITFPAFGWLYLQNRDNGNNEVGQTLVDFNRENDGPINATSPALSIPSGTYDIFHITGQGVGGTARIFRNDIGIFSEPEITGYTNGGGFGLEANIGNGEGSVGANPKSLYSETYSGPWTSDDDLITAKYGFNSQPVNSEAEVTYMKMLGDMAMSQSFGSGVEYSFDPNYIGIGEKASGKKMYHTARKYYDDGSEMSDGMINTRARRSQFVQYFTNAQVKDMFNESYGDVDDNHSKADNHIGRISVTNPDGMVYNYGYPVYNTLRKDVSFSIGAAADEYGTTVSYNSTDNSSSNENGRSNTYQYTETPEYSYAHMLTSVVSNDYVDITGNGPSEDDFGSYTLFKYKKHATTGKYKWRTPYTADVGNIIEGLYNYDGDNMASYSYGEKQVVYLKKIETKTHFAEFITVQREDAIGVADEDGGKPSTIADSDKLSYLQEIVLYVKDPDGGSNHKEIKRVHFEYDYSLCTVQASSVPNNSGESVNHDGNAPTGGEPNINAEKGKLTLKKVYFSHQENLKGALSPYIFTYAENPDYELGFQDSWGSYQTRTKAFGNNTYENPFTNQYADFDDGDQLSSTASTDARIDAASAWNLSKIQLPSGGEINIEYEPDDYAYVQDKPAMNMVRIVNTAEATSHDGGTLKKGSKRVYFRLNEPIKTGTGASDELDKYFKNDDEIYFKAYMKMKGLPSSPTTNINDYVSGYFNRKAGGYNTSYGFDATTTKTNLDGEGGDYYIDAWVDMDLVQLADNSSGWGDVNPIRKAALQHIKYNREDLMEGEMGDLGNISHAKHLVKPVNQLLNFLSDFSDLFFGYYNKAIAAGFGNKIEVNDTDYPSFLRLHCPDQRYGGGHRVSKITFNDGWDDINDNRTGFDDHEYGQTYQYVLEDGTSSGVAEYEPMAGGEESPFRKPLRYDRDEMVSNEKAFYLEEPFNQNLMPSANVGYSRVVVKNLDYEDPYDQSTNTLTGTETQVLEYYTAKDYPVRVARSSLEHKPYEWTNPMKFIGSKYYVSNGYSQGFSIELNDMHGKAKSVASYAYYSGTGSLPNPVTKEFYYYKTEGGSFKSGAANYLNNTVSVIGNGVNTTAEIGVNRDVFVAMRENSNYSQADEYVTNFFTLYGVTAGYQMEFFENTWTMFREISTNKVIARNGILTKTVRSEEGKVTVAENHQFDATTGLPVYTSINNGFKSSVYNYDQSAYWSFDGMEPAYERVGIVVDSEASGSTYLRPGDVCLSESGNVYYVDDTNPGSQTVDLVDEQDVSVLWPTSGPSTEEKLEVVRSYKQNMLSQKAHGITAVGDVLANLNSPLLDHMSVGANNFFGDDDYKNCSDDDMHFVAYFNKVYTPSTVDIQQIVIFTARGANPDEPWGCPIYLNFPGQDDSSDPDNLGFDMETEFSISGNIIAENPFNESNRFTFTYFTGKNWKTTWSAETVTSGCSDCTIFLNQEGGITIGNATGDTISTTSIEGNSGSCKLTCYPGIVQSYAHSFHDDWTYDYEDAGLSSSLITDIGDNPYRYGAKGIVRPYQQFEYVNNRSQRSPTDISQDGMLEYFAPFEFGATNNGYWELASTVTQYSPFGIELENKNEFNSVRSVAIYNPDHIFPLAVAANATYDEVACTGFEETDPSGGVHEGRIKFELSGGGNVVISTSEAHTGKASARVGATDVEYDVSLTSNTDPYFEPEADKDYFFSVWVNLDGNSQGNVKFDINNGTITTFQTSATSPEIEGWQQVSGKMNIPSNATSVKIILESDDGNNIYFDDFRIHPFKGNMKAFVYDLETQRLEAELDDNNYATFYNYDDEGQLFQVKKETENGIATISTHRKNTRLNH